MQRHQTSPTATCHHATHAETKRTLGRFLSRTHGHDWWDLRDEHDPDPEILLIGHCPCGSTLSTPLSPEDAALLADEIGVPLPVCELLEAAA